MSVEVEPGSVLCVSQGDFGRAFLVFSSAMVTRVGHGQICISQADFGRAPPTGAPPHTLLETLESFPHKPTRREKIAGLESFC